MDAIDQQVGMIVLAAGGAARMNGTPKQLLHFREKTLLRTAVETAVETVCKPVIVVLGANFDRTKAEISDLEAEICFNENWQSGLSSSIKCGLRKLLEIHPQSSAVIISLGDQPLIKAEMFDQFVKKFRETKKPIIAAEYGETVGVPALFAGEIFDELFQVENDKGARSIIEKYKNSTEKIPLPEAAFDIDTLEDYENLIENYS